jgi:hypothetical protein
MPPGHAPDFEAPVVVEMFPEHGSAVPDLDEDAFVRFDEPLGDPRSIERALFASPAGVYVVRAGRNNARIRPRDGWRGGVVYRFVIPAGVRDLIRNQTAEPVELLFTTGSAMTRTSTTGRVMDRETVRSVREAHVTVLSSDSIPYIAVADTGGNFSLPSLPTGQYWAFGFRDQNRNLQLDREFEAYDSALVELPDTASAVHLEMWIVPPDSTPPVLGSVEALDSMGVRLEFDDLLDPELPSESSSVRVALQDTGEEWPVVDFVVGRVATVDSVEAEDSVPEEGGQLDAALPPDPALVEDTVGRAVEVDPTAGLEAAATDSVQEPLRARPERTVTVRLGRALLEGTYSVAARGFANLRLLTGGGDTTFVYEPPAPPEPEEGAPEDVDAGAEPDDSEENGPAGSGGDPDGAVK